MAPSDYIVLVDEATASPSEIHAASEFVSFAGQVTGATLPLMATCTQRPRYGAYLNPKFVVIGKNGFTAELGLDDEIDAVGDEGFILRSVGDTIVIAGGPPAGYAIRRIYLPRGLPGLPLVYTPGQQHPPAQRYHPAGAEYHKDTGLPYPRGL